MAREARRHADPDRQSPNWFLFPTASGREREDHPTQKPLALFERLIALFSRPNDLVVDPFAGTGTTAVAALRQGRRWVVVERERRYVRIIERRVKLELRRRG